MKITIPVKAMSLNAYYRIMRSRYIISPKGREYKKTIQDYLKAAKITPTDDDFKLKVNCYFKGARRRDIDNVSKALFDALKGFVYVDDSQMFELVLRKFNNSEEDKIVISWKQL